MKYKQKNKEIVEVTYENETLFLSYKKVMYWPGKKCLILADLHLGKSGFFRQRGIPIPSAIQTTDLDNLASVIDEWRPDQLLITGDMFHHNHNADVAYFSNWKKKYTQLQFTLVPGNHDKLIPIQYEELGIVVTSSTYTCLPFLFIHEWLPQKFYEGLCISGHVHPGVRIRGVARQSITKPCFVLTKKAIILPAFSQFTGTFTRFNAQAEACAAITDKEIVILN